MARITIEDGLKKGYNKFLLVHLAAKRVIELRKGKDPLIDCNNREIVTSLREIEEGRVRMRPESEAYLDMESEFLPPTDNQIEAEAAVQADEEAAAETSVRVEDQEAEEPSAAQADSTADQEGEIPQSETEENEPGDGPNKQESSSNNE